MQLYFLSFLSCSLFCLEVVIKLFDYFWKTIVCFPSLVLTVFWCSTSYTVLIVFWMLLLEPVDALARWWPCASLKCVSGLRRLKKPWTFEMHTCLWPGPQIWFRHKGRNWLHFLFYFSVLMGIVASVKGMSYFSIVFRVLDWSFLVLHFEENVCYWIPKVIWPRMDLFWGFLLENGFFRWPFISMN